MVLIGIIAAIAILVTLFRSFQRRDDSVFKALIESHEREIKAIREQREILEGWKKDIVAERERHERADSLLALKAKQTIIRYEKIPGTVNSYSDDELRRAVTEYAETH